MRTLVLVILFSLPTSIGFCANLCDVYEEYCPFYISTPGGSYPSFADSLHFNPASIPTLPTPFGVEATYSNTSRSRVETDTQIVVDANDPYAEPQESSYSFTSKKNGHDISFAALQGYKGFGLAASKSNGDTFYDYNVSQSFQDTQYNQTYKGFSAEKTINPSLNFGGAVALAEKVLDFVTPTVGASLAYNTRTKQNDLLFGAALNTTFFTLGAGFKKTKEDPISQAPATTTTTVTAGTKISILSAEYTLLYFRASDPALKDLPIFEKPTRFITVAATVDPVQITYAHRRAINVLGDTATQNMWAVRWRATKFFSVAYMKNHIPGSSSLNVQILF